MVRLVERDGKGDCKRVGGDPLFRIKEGLKVFHANNYADDAPAAAKQQPLTGSMLATKAKQLRDEMLAQHKQTPFLTPEEVKGMEGFGASTSWGRKLMYKFGWKEEGDASNNKANATAATDFSHVENLDIASRPSPSKSASRKGRKQQNSPSKAAASDASSPKKTQKATEMKKEMASLKKKLKKAEADIASFEADNAQLRARIATLTGGAEVGSGNGGEGSEEEDVQIEV